MSTQTPAENRTMLVVSAHAGDFVWRAGGTIASHVLRGGRAVVVCMSYGERGESASQWLQGRTLEEIKAIRRAEAQAAADALGAEIRFLDQGDYPLRESDAAIGALVDAMREIQLDLVLTHPLLDPYNGDHPAAARMALEARVQAQAIGVPFTDGRVPTKTEIIGAPPVFFFEPHQPEMCEFKPEVLLDVTPGWARKEAAMQALPAQQHMWDYYQSLGIRRGVQLKRNASANLGLPVEVKAEAFMRHYPQVTDTLA